MPIQQTIAFAIFFTLVGACVGSFLNVVIWRLPHRGREVIFGNKHGRLTLSWPPSHCPICDSAIHWYQNIPVLSWLMLKGQCANCRSPIPVRYPLVELGTAVMFLGLYLAYFVAGWQPNVDNIQHDWGVFVLHLVFASALLAASAIDADLYIIPLSIPWFLAVLGIIASAFLGPPFTDKSWGIVPNLATDHWALAKPILGGFMGLLLANLLMALKLMPRSFDDDNTSGPVKNAERGFATTGPTFPFPKKDEDDAEKKEEPMAPPPRLTKYGPAVAAALAILLIVAALWAFVSLKAAGFVTLVGSIIIFLIGVLPRDAGQVDVTDEVLEEISNPHVRREITKELLFLGLPILCAIGAFYLPVQVPQEPWIGRVLGSLFGLLVGGAIVWFIRIFGSLAFGKEAMGMGDAHLMAGVGAVIGAPLAALAFLFAPFLGIFWAIFLKIMGKPNVLPYGPWLSIASILVLLMGYPALGWYIALMLGAGPLP